MKAERILKKAGSDRSDSPTATDHKWAGNPHGVKNVNVSQGAKVGLMDDKGKRKAHLTAKAEREPIAEHIHNAFAEAGKMKESSVSYWNKLADIDGETKEQRFTKTKAKSKYKD